MPDEVTILQPRVSRKKDNTGGIRQAARQQPEQTRGGYSGKQRINCNHDNPPHQQIKAGKEYRVRRLIDDLQRHTDNGKPPHQAKNRPAPGTIEHPKCERRVGASDKKENCGMFDAPKNTLSLAPWQGVVKGGSKVKKYNGRGKDTRADNEFSTFVLYRMQDHQGRAKQRYDQPDTVTDAVGNFFPFRLLTTGECSEYALDSPFQGVMPSINFLTSVHWR